VWWSLRIVAKVLKLKRVEEESDRVSLSGFRVESEKWDMREVLGKVEGDVVSKLLEVAGEYLVKEKSSDSFVLTEVETLGQKVVIGEGGDLGASTVLIPKPQYLRRVLFVKCNEPSSCRTIYEFKPSSQLIVYEGELVPRSLDYDLAIVECSEHTRIVFPQELVLPKPRIVEKARRRKSRKALKKKKTGKKRGRKRKKR
jgi:hypothetical protein